MWSLATMSLSSTHPILTVSHQTTPLAPPQLDVLMLFGFLTAVLTLLFWMHQGESRSCILALAVCLAAMTVYAFLQGAWPMGMIESVWCAAAVRRWHPSKAIGGAMMKTQRTARVPTHSRWVSESRMTRLFGPN